MPRARARGRRSNPARLRDLYGCELSRRLRRRPGVRREPGSAPDGAAGRLRMGPSRAGSGPFQVRQSGSSSRVVAREVETRPADDLPGASQEPFSQRSVLRMRARSGGAGARSCSVLRIDARSGGSALRRQRCTGEAAPGTAQGHRSVIPRCASVAGSPNARCRWPARVLVSMILLACPPLPATG